MSWVWARLGRTADLVRVLGPREVRLRYRQSALDIAWALISPIAILVVYGLILTESFGVESACAPYLTSAWSGLVMWTFFATALGTAVTSLITSASLISKVYFPREALPLSSVAASLVDLGFGLVTLVVVALLQGVRFSVEAVGALLPLLVLVVWTAAISVWLSVLAAFARDVVHAVHLGLRVGFFATPVMFEAAVLPSWLAWTATWNPVAAAIEGFRSSMLCGAWPDLTVLGPQLLAGSVLLMGAVLYTASVESRVTDVV